MFGLASEEEARERKFGDFMTDDPLPENFAKALEGEETTVGIVAQSDDGGDDDDESAANSAGDAFVGDWMCERASIYIDEDDNVYNVHITWGSSAFERAVWDYTCALDPATGALTGVGKESTETYNDNGELVSTEVVYTDGAATFTIDGDALLWNDAKENVAEGMRFERVEPEGDAEQD